MGTIINVVKRNGRLETYNRKKIEKVLSFAKKHMDEKVSSAEIQEIINEVELQLYDGIKTSEIQEILIRTIVDKVSTEKQYYLKLGGLLLLYDLYKRKSVNTGIRFSPENPYNGENLLKTIKIGIDNNVYDEGILEKYSEDEILELGNYIKKENDYLFNYTGLKVLSDRYLQRIGTEIIELPQELYMLVAMCIFQNEQDKDMRLEKVKKLYDSLSGHKISLATPVLMNCRTKRKNYTSCFVLSLDDDLRSINETLYTAGMISKLAGGLGLYIGKLRASNSSIQNFSGVASGVIPVVKLFNDMMVYVNQLGIRKGSVSITLDMWHKDIKDFLEIKTNAGDERQKAHDVHPAISIPDVFFERLENKKPFSLFDPLLTRTYLTRKFYTTRYKEAIVDAIKEHLRSRGVKLLNVSVRNINVKKFSSTSYSDEPFSFLVEYEMYISGDDKIEDTILPYTKLGYDDIVSIEFEVSLSRAVEKTDKELISSEVSKLKDVKYDRQHKILKVSVYTYGIGLEDFYGDKFKELYEECEKKVPHDEVDSFTLWKRLLTVIFELGEPYIFFRDEANRKNPNKHLGLVYSSNLCMEIIQSMKPLRVINEESMLIGKNIGVKKNIDVGIIPTCNLGAINLGKINIHDLTDLYESISILVEALDNIIDLSEYAVSYPIPTQKRLRPIGIGVMNYHYCLVKNGIKWESEEHLKFADALFEKIAFCTLHASKELAKRKGKYPEFEDSDWSKGIFFGRPIEDIIENSKKNDTNLSESWKDLYREVRIHGIRNGYLLALMPTGSTSLIVGATPSIDPIFDKFYKEENMSGILPQLPPEIDKYFWHYKSAYHIDQEWIIKAGAVRQKWIDQAQSLNLFIDPRNIDGYKLSDLYVLAWKLGLKTVYYCRGKSVIDIDECESCSV